jgi:hypothetical protein
MKFMVVAHMVPVRYRLYISNNLFLCIFIGTYAGADGSRKPTDLELKIAEHQGSHLTQVATALKIGRAALPPKDASTPDPKQK